MTTPASSPSATLLKQRAAELARHAPFAHMRPADVAFFVQAARDTYHAPGDVVLAPEHGVVHTLRFVRRGSVRGERDANTAEAYSFAYEAGELFPIGALLGQRAVSARYVAHEDLFCTEVDAAVVRELIERSPPFAAFLQRRVQQLLQLSTQALAATLQQQALAEQSMELPLSQLPRRAPVACTADTPLREALQTLHDARVGSIVALNEAGAVLGILTRHDVLERVALAQPPMQAAVIGFMSSPVHTLDEAASVHEAALVMSRHGVRHVPITAAGRMVSIVSERDLFRLSQRSLKQVSATIRAARARPALVAAALAIRSFAEQLLRQGLAARSLTALISHLNDLVAQRAVALVASERGVDEHRLAWLAFGSEGRGEQTIATDQDNGLIFVPDTEANVDAERSAWLAFGEAVNLLLAECGYPLCKGNIMARNPSCCLTQAEWLARYERWLERGEPEDLLAASIFFDQRALAGTAELAAPLAAHVLARAPQARRFLRLMAENSLRLRPGLDWRGALDTQADGAQRWLDLKLRGTAPLVDAARLLALAHGVAAMGTRERLLALAPKLQLPSTEAQGWVSAFDALQMLRLRVQFPACVESAPNRIDVALLDDIDRRVLKESLHVVRRLQQRVQMDFLT